MTTPDVAAAILSDIVRELFDRRVIGNLYRPHFVERLVVRGLGDGFAFRGSDWAGWDIERADGLRIEVKQSAALQTWTVSRPSQGSFDIAPRTGHYAEGGGDWIAAPGRQADLYVFGWHPITDPVVADHRDPAQWRFFIVASADLPPAQKTLSRSVLERRWGPELRLEDLRDRLLVIPTPDRCASGTLP